MERIKDGGPPVSKIQRTKNIPTSTHVYMYVVGPTVPCFHVFTNFFAQVHFPEVIYHLGN